MVDNLDSMPVMPVNLLLFVDQHLVNEIGYCVFTSISLISPTDTPPRESPHFAEQSIVGYTFYARFAPSSKAYLRFAYNLLALFRHKGGAQFTSWDGL